MTADPLLDDYLSYITELSYILPHFGMWEYHAGRHCPIPPTEQELNRYVRTGQHPPLPSPRIR